MSVLGPTEMLPLNIVKTVCFILCDFYKKTKTKKPPPPLIKKKRKRILCLQPDKEIAQPLDPPYGRRTGTSAVKT